MWNTALLIYFADIGQEFNVAKYADLMNIGKELPSHNIPDTDTFTQSIPQKELLAAVLYTSGSTGVPKGRYSTTFM